MSETPRRRSLIAIATGLLLMGICLFFVTVAIMMFLSHDLPRDPVASLVFLLVGGSIVLLQYRLLFCCPPGTERHIFGWLLFFAFVVFYTLLMDSGCFRSFDEFYKVLTHPISFTMFIVGSTFIILDIASYIDRQRRIRIVGHPSNGDDWYFTDIAPPFQRYRNREIIGLVLLAIYLGTITTYCLWKMPPKSGEHYSFEKMPPLGRLPGDGSDFNFQYPNTGRFACDFSITEQGFKDWVISHGRWRGWEEVTDMSLPGHPLLDRSIIIDGLRVFPYGESHNGACFDRKMQRAYYWLWRTPM